VNGNTEREGIVVIVVNVLISVRTDFTNESRSLASLVECKPAPKSWSRRVKSVYVDVRNVEIPEFGVASREESSFNTGRKWGRKDLPTLSLEMNIISSPFNQCE
jgi:hypothetical protein